MPHEDLGCPGCPQSPSFSSPIHSTRPPYLEMTWPRGGVSIITNTRVPSDDTGNVSSSSLQILAEAVHGTPVVGTYPDPNVTTFTMESSGSAHYA